jgi:hypothetical protein
MINIRTIKYIGMTVVCFLAVSGRSFGDGFIQGQCGQKIRDSIILSEDIGPCDGPGIIVNKHGSPLMGMDIKL